MTTTISVWRLDRFVNDLDMQLYKLFYASSPTQKGGAWRRDTYGVLRPLQQLMMDNLYDEERK